MIPFLVTIAVALLLPTVIRAITGGGNYGDHPQGRAARASDSAFVHWMLLGVALLLGGILFLGNIWVVLAGVAMLVMGFKSQNMPR